MRILISNDDGINAPGIALAQQAARLISEDVWVLAPEHKRTAAAASVTLGRALTLTELGDQRFSCSGTPADCVVSAMGWLFKGRQPPDLVLSGVNDGLNVAEDIAYSGTLGIAREAAFWGLPAIAFSRVKTPSPSPADASFLAALIQRMWDARKGWLIEGHWLSVNLPSRLPAAIAQPEIGRDKIARQCEILAISGDQTTLLVPRGRAGTGVQGDENSMLAAGYCTINRLNWFGETRLKDKLVQGLLPDRTKAQNR